MGKRAKRHHIVPEVLQKQFLATDRLLWYAEKSSEEYQKPQLRSPKGAFWERNRYTILEDDEPSDVIEKEVYGPVDDYLGRLLPKLNGHLDNGFVPKFSDNALDSLRNVVFEMIKRTPDFAGFESDFDIGTDLITSTIARYEREAPEDPELDVLRKELADEARLKELGRDIRVRATLGRSQRVAKELASLKAVWARVSGRSSFVLSSMIVCRTGNGGPNGLAHQSIELWMPISPKNALILLRDPEGRIPMIVDEPSAHVRSVNEYAVRNSWAIASHSEKLIKSLLR